MDRRKFIQLASLAAPGVILASNAAPVHAAASATHRAYKGFGTGAKTQTAVDQMLQLNLDWFYTWGKLHNLGEPANDFTPMIWGASGATSEVIAEIEANLWKTSSTRLLGFNEPDHSSQSNMSVDRALELWPILETTKLKLGSPATVSPNSPWMNEFMTRAIQQGRRIDFVACHIYQSPSASTFLRKIDDLHARWGKPIWITETAVADWEATENTPSRYGRTQVNEYLQEIWAGVQLRPFVERFAWKTRASLDPQMGTGAFFHTNGTITSTGSIYAAL